MGHVCFIILNVKRKDCFAYCRVRIASKNGCLGEELSFFLLSFLAVELLEKFWNYRQCRAPSTNKLGIFNFYHTPIISLCRSNSGVGYAISTLWLNIGFKFSDVICEYFGSSKFFFYLDSLLKFSKFSALLPIPRKSLQQSLYFT